MKLMPFNFDRINDDTVFLSNLAGFHQFLSEENFSQLVGLSVPDDPTLADALESKLFISGDDEQAFTASVLSSGFAKRIMSDLAVMNRPGFYRHFFAS